MLNCGQDQLYYIYVCVCVCEKECSTLDILKRDHRFLTSKDPSMLPYRVAGCPIPLPISAS